MTGDATIETLSELKSVTRAEWDALANPPYRPYNPFVSWDFLEAMESSGSARPETGWQPAHLALRKDGMLAGVMPGYLKGHSQGEYIFDHAFADAYARAGGRYYPKYLSAAPFTPATGPRLLAHTEEDRALLAGGAVGAAAKMGLSGAHLNFLTEDEAEIAVAQGYALRIGEQYHFEDKGFGDWQGFLDALTSRRRKDLRKERQSILDDGIEVEWITGREIDERHLDAFWWFYQDTGARKWGSPYLTRTAFTLLAERMADRLLFIFARKNNEYIAGAMNMIGGDTLFGRYWGCSEYVPFLHFELCYYQAIDYALANGLRRVEAGAQGEHKIARGYEPVPIRSAHRMIDEGFQDAVRDYLAREKEHIEHDIDLLKGHTPFKKGG
ncbi:N-acetyltransferase [Parvularcula sp. ZS-1/3]|uniref:N-acetyltransferase n=1 Tax=Parvularcula mediterranea TaxID=2732508 RepID=A0A7Y3RN80_9PROT|nr:GNAT family N-acetyltransferase [Parvularcula mediterranea]NNU17176.1 N-acetyltransferase [Parvularcula mediterranea]